MIRHSLYRRGKYWQLSFQWQHKRYRQTLQTTRKVDAEELAQIHIRNVIRECVPVVTLGELALRYLNVARIEKRSWKSDKSMMTAVLGYFGPAKSLNEIKPVDVQGFKTAMSQRQGKRGRLSHATLSHATVNRHLALLKTMFNKAIEWEIYHKPNPSTRVKLYMESSKQEYFTQAEVRRLLEAAKQVSEAGHSDIQKYFVYILTVAIMTGMRLGEILRMRWSDISDGFITIRAESAKSKRSRQVPAAPELLAILSRLPSVTGEDVFPVRKNADVIKPAWKKVKAMALVKPMARFHNLRHSFASFLVQSGVDITTVKELLGHSDIAMTAIYSHSSQTKKLEAIKGLKILNDV